MKIEVRCPDCAMGYLVDEATIPATGAGFTCQRCGAEVHLARRPRSPASSKNERPGAGRSPGTAAVPGPFRRAQSPTAGVSSTTSPSTTLEVFPRNAEAAPASGPPRDVVCPRCGLHFVPAGAKTVPGRRERLTVLVVEDMEYFLEIAREALSSSYEVKIARTAEDARRVLASGGVDLLLLDLTLQREDDGAELLRELPVKPCPILIFTAQDESEMYGDTWERLRELGADDIVIKGLNVGESLLRKVGALLGEETPEDVRP